MGWSAYVLEVAADYDIFRAYSSQLTAWEAAYNADFDKVMLILQKQNADFLNSLP